MYFPVVAVVGCVVVLVVVAILVVVVVVCGVVVVNVVPVVVCCPALAVVGLVTVVVGLMSAMVASSDKILVVWCRVLVRLTSKVREAMSLCLNNIIQTYVSVCAELAVAFAPFGIIQKARFSNIERHSRAKVSATWAKLKSSALTLRDLSRHLNH